MRSLWYTGYVVSGLTFLVLAYVEWQIPGFVSQVFPLYLVLIVAVACGVGAMLSKSSTTSLSRRSELLALVIGIVFSVLVFKAADALGAFRLLLAIVVLVLPNLLLKALSDVKE
jgi:hypothetical protein